MGLCGYYRRFIANFAKRELPLTKLLRKNVTFDWSDGYQKSFDDMKNALTTAPVLAFPDFSLPFHLYSNASGDAVGSFLGQIQNGCKRVIAYAGRTLSQPEKAFCFIFPWQEIYNTHRSLQPQMVIYKLRFEGTGGKMVCHFNGVRF